MLKKGDKVRFLQPVLHLDRGPRGKWSYQEVDAEICEVSPWPNQPRTYKIKTAEMNAPSIVWYPESMLVF